MTKSGPLSGFQRKLYSSKGKVPVLN